MKKQGKIKRGKTSKQKSTKKTEKPIGREAEKKAESRKVKVRKSNNN